MKKLLMLVSALAALSLLAPNAGYALGENGYMGLYFDTAGQTSCTTGVFLTHVTAYIVYALPVIDSSRGFQCGIIISSPAKDAQLNTTIAVTYPVPATDVGVNAYPKFNYITGYSTPQLIGDSFVFATLDIFVLDMDTQLNFTLEYADPVTLGTKPIVM